MLKTNSKKVRDAVRSFILNNSEGWEKDPKTFEEACAIVRDAWDRFKYPKLRHYYATTQDAFIDWARGLPLFMFEYFNAPEFENMRDHVGRILEQTEEERARYSNDDAAILWTKLIFAEISKVCPITL